MLKTFMAFLVAGLLTPVLGGAAEEGPVQWAFSAKQVDATTYEVHLTATLEDGWHLYSQSTPEGGPKPTVISFDKNPSVSLKEPAREEGKLEQHFEPLFGVKVKQFSGKVDFVQTVKVTSPGITVAGSVSFMTCDDEQCLPPKTVSFSIPLG